MKNGYHNTNGSINFLMIFQKYTDSNIGIDDITSVV